MDKPFFSVIVPAHNSSAWIRRGLDSIRSQDFKDYELIVVCDDCTDTTADVAREYTDRVIEVCYGLDGMARNAGIDAAQGKYILFMDDDDWWLHEFAFSMIYGRLKDESTDILLYDFIWKERGYTTQVRGHRAAVWSKAWKREAIGDTRFPDTPYWSDVEFDKAMFKKKLFIGFLMSPLYYYNYMREGSISWRQKQGEIK